MHGDTILRLVSEIDAQTEECKEVFATVESVGQREFFEAAQMVFNSEYKVTLWLYDYDWQNIVEMESFGKMERYAVYRKYSRSDEKVELYLTDKTGVFYGG